MADVPIVFISSTCEDLKDHRLQAEMAAKEHGFFAKMLEYFPAEGKTPSLQYCLDEVATADVVVVLVAERYGWVPKGPTNRTAKSITWLECEHAWNKKKEVLAFLVDPAYRWPPELREDYRLTAERKKPGISEEVTRNERNLAKFKQKLSRTIRKGFTDPASVRALVGAALSTWLQENRHETEPLPGTPEIYLRMLEEDTSQIRIKGLRTKRAEPYIFPIDEIYIPLTTLSNQREKGINEERRVGLEQELSHRNVVIVGDPGSGKSTFLRRAAYELCRTGRGTRPPGTPPFLAADDTRFPILIRIADLAKRLSADKSPKPDDSPDWIPYFLGKQSEEDKWGLGEAFFQKKLQDGGCLMMFDGLDEAPDSHLRERIARLFEKATRTFKKCDFLVSTRPASYSGDSVLNGFHSIKIADLEPDEIAFFFEHFARGLALSEAESKKFKDDLNLALESRFEIRDMARNPVMLTALAVLQHNDQRLPEYRVELYGSILDWLASAHEHEGLPKAERCLEIMRKLALSMQEAPGGRLVQINQRSAAELTAKEFDGTIDENQTMLERETQDAGMLSSVSTDFKFWHLSFQEYLAAREIAGLTEKQQIALVTESGRLYRPEWREVMLLLGGLLKLQGEPKIEGLFEAILGKLATNPPLKEQAKCVALLGAMMRDLSPMGYVPKTPAYERTVKTVMAIFQPGEAEQIDIKTRIEAADALGQVGDPRLAEDNWVTIPAGTFLMGAQKQNEKGPNYDPEARDDEIVHEVTLPKFRIRRFAVTVQEYATFIAEGGYSESKYWAEGFGKYKEPEDWERQQKFPNRPVVSVSWFETAAYCAWAGCRLPTEAEWERAARGPRCSRYPWGNEPPLDPTFANYEGIDHATPVGLFPKGNASWGQSGVLCDMLGNVYEWCADWYGPYEKGRQQNPRGPKAGKQKIMRGGSWIDNPEDVRVSNRGGDEPTNRSSNIGFRCAGELS